MISPNCIHPPLFYIPLRLRLFSKAELKLPAKAGYLSDFFTSFLLFDIYYNPPVVFLIAIKPKEV